MCGASLLKHKVALVTGGGGGIGKAISLALASHGAKVIVAERDPDRANETVAEILGLNGQAIGAVIDVQKREHVAAMAEPMRRAVGTAPRAAIGPTCR